MKCIEVNEEMPSLIVLFVSGCQSSYYKVYDEDQIDDHKGEEIGIAKEGAKSSVSHNFHIVIRDSGLKKREEGRMKG